MSSRPAEVARNAAPSPAEPAFLRIENVGKSFGAQRVLDSISLDINRGEFLTLLGESGSGKTTLLRIIAGFEQATSGQVFLEGQRLDTLPPHRRPVHTVFQSYALFPHMTVFDNVAYGLRVRAASRTETKSRVEAALAKVRMERFATHFPRQISGGQKQRVALARALVNQPKVLLLDEPLSALDANLRVEMQRELKLLQQDLGITFLFVTHDQSEALAMSNRVAVFNNGGIAQLGSPDDLYARPQSAFVADFIGENNTLHGIAATVSEGRCKVKLDGGGEIQASSIGAVEGAACQVAVRPERLQLAADNGTGENLFQATVAGRLYLGDHLRLLAKLPNGQVLTVKMESDAGPSDGEAVTISCSPADCRAFSVENNASPPISRQG